MPHLHTLLAHAATSPDESTRGLVPAIQLSTTFERDADGSYPRGYKYAREDTPTRRHLEEALATIEGGSTCCAFASGMAASNAVLQALPATAHILIPDDVYHGFRRLVQEVYAHRGLQADSIDMTQPERVRAAVRPDTRLIWVETPSNPMLKITDIGQIAAIARSVGAALVVDGTWTTPVLQRPLEAGADLVVHSLTKYIAGHSDTLGGAVIANEATSLFERVTSIQKMAGAVLDPFSSWLTLRGMKSLAARIERQCSTAARIAAFLDNHRRVRHVYYPGLPDHPGHETAAAQMTDFGAMLSFEVEGGRQAAVDVAAHTCVFTRATSLGGTESLIEHRASMEGPESRTPDTLLRLSVGLEHPADLIDDLDSALMKS